MTIQTQVKLRWQCRRGMLELDLLLLPFLEKVYLQLSPAEQAQFEQLLAASDQDLYHWLVKCEQPSELSLVNIIERVRKGV